MRRLAAALALASALASAGLSPGAAFAPAPRAPRPGAPGTPRRAPALASSLPACAPLPGAAAGDSCAPAVTLARAAANTAAVTTFLSRSPLIDTSRL